jgi:nitrate/nitrite-specific signal transduction histidine kinase
VRAELPVRPPAGVEAIAYFVVAEALTNVVKHARASHAEVVVGYSGSLHASSGGTSVDVPTSPSSTHVITVINHAGGISIRNQPRPTSTG